MNFSAINSQSTTVGRAQRLHAAPVATQKVTSTVGRMMGTTVRDSLAPGLLARDAALSGLSNIPFDGLFSSQAYRRGELKANEYAARILGDSVGFGAWTVGGALAGVALAPLGLPALAVGILGFAAGMTTQEIFDRTIGHTITKKLAGLISEKSAKPLADAFTKYIANPLNDYVWRPVIDGVKGHKFLAAGLAGALALKFPGAAKVVGEQALTMGGGMAAGLAINLGVITPAFGASEVPFEKKEAADDGIDPKWIATFNTARKRLADGGATPEKAVEGAYNFFVKTMVTNGATQEDATNLVTAIAKAALQQDKATAKTAGNGKAYPAGLLMVR